MARISFIGACAPTQQMGDLDGRIVHARYSVLLTARSIHTWSCAGYARRAGTEQGEPVDARDACVYGSVLCVAGGTAPSSSTSRAFAASIQIQMLCWKIIRGSTRPVLVSCVPCGPSVGLGRNERWYFSPEPSLSHGHMARSERHHAPKSGKYNIFT